MAVISSHRINFFRFPFSSPFVCQSPNQSEYGNLRFGFKLRDILHEILYGRNVLKLVNDNYLFSRSVSPVLEIT